jgi:hypothetical protein
MSGEGEKQLKNRHCDEMATSGVGINEKNKYLNEKKNIFIEKIKYLNLNFN